MIHTTGDYLCIFASLCADSKFQPRSQKRNSKFAARGRYYPPRAAKPGATGAAGEVACALPPQRRRLVPPALPPHLSGSSPPARTTLPLPERIPALPARSPPGCAAGAGSNNPREGGRFAGAPGTRAVGQARGGPSPRRRAPSRSGRLGAAGQREDGRGGPAPSAPSRRARARAPPAGLRRPRPLGRSVAVTCARWGRGLGGVPAGGRRRTRDPSEQEASRRPVTAAAPFRCRSASSPSLLALRTPPTSPPASPATGECPGTPAVGRRRRGLASRSLAPPPWPCFGASSRRPGQTSRLGSSPGDAGGEAGDEWARAAAAPGRS
ncbi:hypothetical protein J1605_014986 [Eschrichtius robustus]|uniref:Uncharacterized protein n=1 Tax=Eschrichtius robustus TaxID=9764 RepID=A0AB34GC60_ESCRO|nr:hypothetical protein J1605_014986 [Eschrichtius robustus]